MGVLGICPWALATTPVTLNLAINTLNSNEGFTLEFILHLCSVWQEVGATHLWEAEKPVGSTQESGCSPGNRAKDTSASEAFPRDKASQLEDVT